MGTLLKITLAAQLVLFVFTAISFLSPTHRAWPPPSRHSWQLYATWFLAWGSLSGVFVLAVFDSNLMQLPVALRLGAGIPLEAIGILLVVERPLDTIRTAVNVEGDMIGALVTQNFLNKSNRRRATLKD